MRFVRLQWLILIMIKFVRLNKIIGYSIFFLLGIVLFPNELIGQEETTKVSFNWTEEDRRPSVETGFLDYFKVDNSYIVKRFGERFSNIKFFLDSYDSSLVKQSTIEILKDYEDGREFREFIVIKNNMYLITSLFDFRLYEEKLFVETVNLYSNKLNNDRVEFSKKSTRKKTVNANFSFDLRTSPDGKITLLVVDDYNLRWHKEQKKVNIFALGSNLQLLWSKMDYVLDEEEMKFTLDKCTVSNSGAAFLMGHEMPIKTNTLKMQGKPYNDNYLIAFADNGETISKISFKKESTYINSYEIKAVEEDMVLGAGYYSNDLDGHGDGVFVFTIDVGNKEVLNFEKNEFALEFLREDENVRDRTRLDKLDEKKSSIAYPHLMVNQVLYSEDGSVKIIGEQYYSQSKCLSGDCWLMQFYGDIVVTEILDGRINWTAKIPKFQKFNANDLYYASYLLKEIDGSLIFIYNDNINNHPKIDIKKGVEIAIANEKKWIVAKGEISANGQVDRSIIYKWEDQECFFRPNRSTLLKDDFVMIIGGFNKNSVFGGYKFGTLNFK
jgi:hypothetical protein